MVNSEELIGTIEYLTLWARCRVNRFRCNRVRLYLHYIQAEIILINFYAFLSFLWQIWQPE